MRTLIVFLMIVFGFGLQAVSFFLLAAPLGLSTSPFYSDPRVEYAPTLFIIGVMTVFMSAVVYELLPEKTQSEPS